MTSFRSIVVAAGALCATVLFAGSAQAAIYVQFDGIDGESRDHHHRNWCDVQSFSRGVTAPGSGATGQSRRRGAVQFSDLTLTRNVDKASVKLEEAVAQGRVIPRVTLDVTATYGGARATYFQIVLTNVRVTSYSQQLSNSEMPVTEEVSLAFETASVTYTQYDSSGRRAGNVSYEWRAESSR